MMDLIDVLRGGRQCDEDGDEIIMCRQACVEAADELAAMRERVKELEQQCDQPVAEVKFWDDASTTVIDGMDRLIALPVGTKIYTAPPTPPTVVMAYRVAAAESRALTAAACSTVGDAVFNRACEWVAKRIESLAPSDAEKALEELGMDIADEMYRLHDEINYRDDQLDIVQRVIKGE